MAIRLLSDGEDLDRTFTEDLVTIGRGPGNTVRVASPRVSGIHGQILRRDGRYWYQDLGSTNGSLVRLGEHELVVDGRTVREAPLEHGAQLVLGDRREPVVFAIELLGDEAVAAADDDGALRASIARTVVASRAVGELGRVSDALLDDGAGRSRVRAAFELVHALQQHLDAPSIATRLATFIFEHLALASVAGIFFETERAGIVPLLLRTRTSPEPLAIPWRRVEPLFHEAVGQRAAILVDDAALVASRFEQAAPSLRAVMACPLVVGEDQVRGLLVAAGPERFSQRDLDLLSLVAAQAALVLRNARLLGELQELRGRLEDENSYLRQSLEREPGHTVELIGESALLKRVLRQVEIVARTDTTVLVLGETGTGKELVARMLHRLSPRADRLFAAVNCGALSETLLESELFGHVKGAFTGATRDKKGLFEVADGGTLFLDEFGDVSPRLQVKLLRVLENGEVTPVGSVRTRHVDVRIVAATNKDLKAEVDAARFREDLYYRINVFPVRLPPLRERTGDVRLLAAHFLRTFAERFDKRIEAFAPQTLERLVSYAWPGNVRELQNEIERAVLLADDGRPISPEDLSERIGGMVELPVTIGPLHETLDRLEAQYIRRALMQHDYNRTRTAKTLGISRQALTAKLHKYDLIDLK